MMTHLLSLSEMTPPPDTAAMPDIAEIISIASLALQVLVGLILFIGIFIGYKRGLLHTLLRLGTVLLTAALSVVGTMFLREHAADPIDTLLKTVIDEETFRQLTESSATLNQLLHQLPLALAGPLVFFALFLTLNFIFYIIFKILAKISLFAVQLLDKTFIGKLRIGRTLGAFLNVFVALLLVCCFVIPFSGYLGMVNDIADEIEHVEGLDESIVEPVLWADEEIVTPIGNNIVFKTANALCKKPIFNTVTRCEINGENVVLSNEAAYICNTYVTLTPLLETGFDLARFGDREAAAIRKFANDFDNSHLVLYLVGELIPHAAKTWANNEAFIGMENPAETVNPELKPLINNVMIILQTTTPQTLKGDLVTIAELIATLAESGTLKLMGESMTAKDLLLTLSEPGVISGLIDTLYENDRMQVLVADIANLGFDAIGDSLNIPETDETLRADLTADLNNAIKEAEALEGYDAQVDSLADSIENIFEKYGMDADADEALLYAESIIGYGSITEGNPEASAEDYFTIISNAMSSSVQSVAASDDAIAAAIEKYRAKGGEKGLDIAEQLAGKKDLKHSVVTLEHILLSAEEVFNMSDEEFKKQSKALEDVIVTILDVIVIDRETGAFSFDFVKLDTEKLSAALRDFAGTRLDGEGNELHNLANAVTNLVKFALGKTGINPGAANNLVDHLVDNKVDENGESKDTLSTAIKVVTIIQNENADKETIKESVTVLAKDLDKESAEVLADCVSPNLINQYGGSGLGKERTEALVSVTQDMIINFGEHAEELTEEQMEAETVYMQTIFELATNAGSTKADHLFTTDENDEASLGITAEDFVDTIQHSTIISETFIEESDNLAIAINDKMADSDKEELLAAINASDAIDPALKDALLNAFALSNK